MSDTLLTPRFHLIGTQLAAWRDNSGGAISTIKTDTGTANVALSASADTGAFGSSMIAMASSSKIRAARYAGQNNWSDVAAFSVLMRIIPRWTGAPAAAEQGFFYASTPWTSIAAGVYLGMDTSGAVFVGYYDQFGTAYVSNVDFAATYTGFVSGTAVDLLFTWDGTSSANSVKFYVNGVSTATKSPAAGNPSVNNLNMGSIVFGMSPNGGTLSNYDLNEAAIWNYVLSASDITNLTNRSTFLATTAFDGTSYTDPGISSVKTGVSYTQAGVVETGTYDGSDRWTDPGIANVRSATAYKANSTSNNRTGTAAIPGANDVRNGVSTDATTGNLVVPATSDVHTGVTFDHSSSSTGTYDGSDRWTDPGASNVKHQVAYKANSTTNNQTGTYTGTDEYSDPGIANVLSGVSYLAAGATVTGTLQLLTNTMKQMQLKQSSVNTQALVVTQGDSFTMHFLAIDDTGTAFDLTGASFSTKMLNVDGSYLVLANAVHTANPDQVAHKGEFTVALSGTTQLKVGATRGITTTIVSGADSIQFHGAITVLTSAIT